MGRQKRFLTTLVGKPSLLIEGYYVISRHAPSLKLGHRTILTRIEHFDSLFIREHKNIRTEEIKNNIRTEEHKMNFTNKRT